MSKFSGKCDFKDVIDIHGLPSILSSDIYIGGNIVPLRIESEKDCIPYYAHIVYLANFSRDGPSKIYLTSESYIDQKEEKHLTSIFNNILRIYNRCKRKHLPINEETILQQMASPIFPAETEIIKRIVSKGSKATTQGIHISIYNYYRDKLYNEMIAHDYDPTIAYYWIYHEYKKGE